MDFYLMRHAEAVPGEPDGQRPLSPRGTLTARRVGQFLHAHESFAPTRVFTSSLVRARETASFFLEGLGRTLPLATRSGLEPEADPEIAYEEILCRLEEPVLLVGHNPHLEALVSRILAGSYVAASVDFQKGSILALERFGGSKTGWHWSVRWLLAPELLTEESATVATPDPAASAIPGPPVRG